MQKRVQGTTELVHVAGMHKSFVPQCFGACFCLFTVKEHHVRLCSRQKPADVFMRLPGACSQFQHFPDNIHAAARPVQAFTEIQRFGNRFRVGIVTIPYYCCPAALDNFAAPEQRLYRFKPSYNRTCADRNLLRNGNGRKRIGEVIPARQGKANLLAIPVNFISFQP